MKNNDDCDVGNITAGGTPIDNKEKPKKTLRVYQNLNEEEAKVTESSQDQQIDLSFTNASPSKMTEEEKVQFSIKLFREADQLSEKISSQIQECQVVREGMKVEIEQTKQLLEDYRKEEKNFFHEIQNCKDLYHKSKLQYNEIAEKHLLQFKRKGSGTGGGIRKLLSPSSSSGEFNSSIKNQREAKNFLVRNSQQGRPKTGNRYVGRILQSFSRSSGHQSSNANKDLFDVQGQQYRTEIPLEAKQISTEFENIYKSEDNEEQSAGQDENEQIDQESTQAPSQGQMLLQQQKELVLKQTLQERRGYLSTINVYGIEEPKIIRPFEAFNKEKHQNIENQENFLENPYQIVKGKEPRKISSSRYSKIIRPSNSNLRTASGKENPSRYNSSLVLQIAQPVAVAQNMTPQFIQAKPSFTSLVPTPSTNEKAFNDPYSQVAEQENPSRQRNVKQPIQKRSAAGSYSRNAFNQSKLVPKTSEAQIQVSSVNGTNSRPKSSNMVTTRIKLSKGPISIQNLKQNVSKQ